MELGRFFGFAHPSLVHFPLVLLLISVGIDMAVFSRVGGALLFTHVHSNAPFANVAVGVYVHHTTKSTKNSINHGEHEEKNGKSLPCALA